MNKTDLLYTDLKVTTIPNFQIPKKIVIETDSLSILHRTLWIKIDIDTETLKGVDQIVINGVSFMREKN